MKLEIRELKAAPGGKEILHGIDLAAHKGQFVGIIGPNGSGKSTLLKCVYRTLRPTGGAVLLDGCPQESCSPRQWAQKLAVVAQHNACAFDLTVEEMVRMGRAPPQARPGAGHAPGQADHRPGAGRRGNGRV